MPRAPEPFLVVGVGASAGGIAVLKEFFRHIPPSTGNAYVVILHLSPDHDSLLSEILQTVAAIPVTQVTERVKLEADHAYVIAPNRSLSMVDGHLVVSDAIGFEARRAPVDIFFRTLADARESHAVCVILSGTGPNGSMGLKRVKERGGIAIAQDPDEAEFDGMPRNALATGLVDYVLPVRDIPAKILAYQERLQRLPDQEPADEDHGDERIVREILTAVRAQTGHDFVQYKRGTILRRIQRRISVHELTDLAAYRDYVRGHPEEASALLRDLLISVTHFFRDPQAWATLESTFVPRLFERRRADEVIRVWAAGCATGEEAYSLAMILSDAAATLAAPARFQVFATDIDADAIAIARAGLYTNSDVADVPPDRLNRFFVREPEGYRVRRELRDGILFTVHNVLRDPPFSSVDLVSCRNLLIYLNRTAQDRVMELMHFALRPGGYLFLGGSELIASFGELFAPVDKDHRIGESRAVPRRLTVLPREMSGISTIAGAPGLVRHEGAAAPSQRPLQPLELHHRLLEAYGPPSIVIDEDHEIVHMSPRAGRYLRFPSGEASTNLLALVRPELRVELRAAVSQALQQRTSVEAAGLRVDSDGAPRVNLRVRPVLADESARGLLLVVFEEIAADPLETAEAGAIRPIEPAMRLLEDELARVRGQLRATTEQYGAQYDEFKASNEELHAMNEELRSAAEELETSKEELQSVNEELTTVNQELKIKIEELGQANNDFRNLINSTDIATIFLDRSLCVKQYTPRATEIFNLLPGDVGRPLLDLTHRLAHAGLRGDMEQVLDRLQIVEREVQGREGTWYGMRVLPYRTADDRLDGVVLTFVDITGRKQAAESLREAHDKLALAQRASESALWERDLATGVERWSPEMHQLRGVAPSAATAITDHTVGVHPDDRDRVAAALDEVLRRGDVEWDVEFRVGGAAGAPIRWIAERGKVRYADGRAVRLLGVDFDTTAHKALETAQQTLNEDLERRVAARTSELFAINETLTQEIAQRELAERDIRDLLQRVIGAQEEERRRIARDLHDHLGQQLTALRLSIAVCRDHARDDDSLLQHMARAETVATQLDADIEFLAWELRPAPLAKGIREAIESYAHEWSRHFGIAIDVHAADLDQNRLPSQAQLSLYRIVQEALNNVAKHARATCVAVILEQRDGRAVLVVEDNGSGFDPRRAAADRPEHGLGLTGMRERAALASGTIDVESAIGKGTTVIVRIPLQPSRS